MIFSTERRRAIRARMKALAAPTLFDASGADLLDRLAFVQRDFADVLIVGHMPPGLSQALPSARLSYLDLTGDDRASLTVGDLTQPHFSDASFDLILVNGLLDTVDDVPGALILLRRALQPGGLLLGALPGEGSLAKARTIFAEIGAASGKTVARFHPQIALRSMGDLLQRAGYQLPVVDLERHDLPAASLAELAVTLRRNGLGNALTDHAPLSRDELQRFDAAFAAQPGDTINLIYFTGWAADAA